MRKCSFLTLELALLLALAVTLLWGAWSLHRQDDLQEKMIRLHVIANSDSDADQTLKLCVRDAVLCRAEEILRQSADMTEARARLRDSLPDIGDAAAQELAAQGSGYSVSVALEDTEFPRKTYDGFALPTGEYLALRVVIGAGEGRNWWCVMFPPLCILELPGGEIDYEELRVNSLLLKLLKSIDGGKLWNTISEKLR